MAATKTARKILRIENYLDMSLANNWPCFSAAFCLSAFFLWLIFFLAFIVLRVPWRMVSPYMDKAEYLKLLSGCPIITQNLFRFYHGLENRIGARRTGIIRDCHPELVSGSMDFRRGEMLKRSMTWKFKGFLFLVTDYGIGGWMDC